MLNPINTIVQCSEPTRRLKLEVLNHENGPTFILHIGHSAKLVFGEVMDFELVVDGNVEWKSSMIMRHFKMVEKDD